MKLLIVNNLKAGPGDGAIYDYIRMMSGDGDEICLRSTDGTTDAADLVYDAAGFDAVIVAGGDGTITQVAYALAYSQVPILPFPAGTANLMTNNLNGPVEPRALAAMTRAMRTLDFDLGEIEAHGERFGFGIMAGAGYDATIMHAAEPNKKMLGPVAYFSAAVANALPQRSHITLTVDGRTYERDGLGVLLVNFSKMQFEVTVTHENEPRDGAFDVVILKAENAFGLIPAVIAGLLDREGGYPSRTDSLEILKGKSVQITADPPFEIQFDGEIPGLSTPMSGRVLPGAVRFILSEEGYAQFNSETAPDSR